jgi:glycosyltransferase involved in cell wall biosynthesis
VYGRDPAALYWLGHRLHRPFVYEAHHLPTTSIQQRIIDALFSSPWLKGIVVISDVLRQDMLEQHPALKNTRIITAHDGADVPDRSPQPIDLSEPGEEPTLHAGYVGSLYQGRGIDFILALADRMKEVRFHLLGGTSQEIAGWRKRGVPDNVRFHGHRPHHEVQTWLAAFNVLLAPYPPKVQIGTGYDTGRWMSPLKIFEYMAAGKPIIASDLPVLREVLMNRKNAFLAKPEDIVSWQNAIIKLIYNPQIRQSFSREALDTLRQKYSWNVRAKAILKTFNKQ